MDGRKIRAKNLRAFLEAALAELEKRFPEGMPVHDNSYREVPLQAQFGTASKPSLVVGSLYDDLDFLDTAMKAGREALPTSLFHASALLNYLALHAQDDAA